MMRRRPRRWVVAGRIARPGMVLSMVLTRGSHHRHYPAKALTIAGTIAAMDMLALPGGWMRA